jgi:iron complex transport system substrate-binding protein
MSRPSQARPGLSRRAFGGALASAMLALVAACGGGDSASNVSAAQTGSPSSPAAFPVSITHKYGSTEIPKSPQRIVVVGLTEQDALLALGVVPVATTKWFGENPGEIWPWAKAKLGSAPVPQVLTNTDGIQFEKVAALTPDLVIGVYSGLTQEDYNTLSKIAPTIAQPSGVVDFGASWDVITRTVAKAVGKPAEAEKLISDTQALFDDVVTKNPDFKGKTALMATTYEGYYVYGPQDARGRLLESLGFTLPAGLQAVTGKEFGANISKERIDLLDTDALVWLVTDDAKDKAKVQADPLYAALDVKKQGRDIYLEDGEPLGSATSFISVLSLPFLLDGLVPQLAQAVDGDPATAVTRLGS